MSEETLSNIDSNTVSPPETSMPSSPKKKSQRASLKSKRPTRRNIVESRKRQEQHVDDQSHEKVIQILLGDQEDSIRSREAKIVRDFFSSGNDATSTSGDNMAWAWLEYNQDPTVYTMDIPTRVNAADLCPTLSNLRHRYGERLPFGPQLTYIPRLTPEFAGALAVIATEENSNALQNAVRKHITMETAIHVQNLDNSTLDFCFEFHLVYPVLLKFNALAPVVGAGNSDSIDLSFLDLEPSSGPTSNYAIRQANISVVVYGMRGCSWTGYAFANTGNIPEGQSEKEGHERFRQEFFEMKRGPHPHIRTELSEPSAKEHWKKIFAIRCGLVLKEWRYLVHAIEDAIKAHRVKNPCNGRNSGIDLDPKDIRKSLDWNIQIMQLLNTLFDTLSITLRAYNRLEDPDAGFYIVGALGKITRIEIDKGLHETFEKLVDIHSRLVSLTASCKDFSTHLGRILDLERNRLTIESNKITMESHSLNERTHELNVRTSILNDEMRKLNEMSTKAACANQADAAKTSRSTRINLEMLLFTTPLAMVLQYFGSDKAVFSFERNPKTFVLAVLIFMVVLRLFALLFEYAESLLRLVPWKGAKAPKNNTPEPLANQSGFESVHSV